MVKKINWAFSCGKIGTCRGLCIKIACKRKYIYPLQPNLRKNIFLIGSRFWDGKDIVWVGPTGFGPGRDSVQRPFEKPIGEDYA